MHARTAPPSLAEPCSGAVEFEALITDLSSRFIGAPAGAVDGEVGAALSQVCAWAGVDLVVLWQWSSAAADRIVATHAHDALGPTALPEPVDEAMFPWVRQQMLAGRIVRVPSLDDLPPAAALDRDSARRQGVKSNLTLPLTVGDGPPVGALALNTMLAERDWPDDLVARLRLVAQLVSSALARRRTDEALRESEERLRMAADAADAGFWTQDEPHGAFWVSPRVRSIFGFGPDEVIDLQRVRASVHPDDRDRLFGALDAAWRSDEVTVVEFRVQVPGEPGSRWVVSRGRPTPAAGDRPRRLMGLSIDVTVRRRADAELRRSQARLAAGAELAGLGFYEVDFGAGTAYVDDRLCDMLGVAADGAHGQQPLQHWLDHLHPEDRDRVLEVRQRLHDGRLERAAAEYRCRHPSRGEVWLDHLASVAERDAAGRALRVYGVVRDVTVKKAAELALRDMSRRLIAAQEAERALIARELHDDLTQRVATLAIEVGCAELSPAAPHAGTLQRVREQLVRLSDDIHALAYQLHPSILDELGLVEALRAECERRRRLLGPTELHAPLDPVPVDLDKDVALCLFRVAQGALSNVARHAAARSATVRLQRVERGLLLTVHDDGVGFDARQPVQGRHLGLLSMRERLHTVGGSFELDSAPGAGTTVLAWVPLGGAAR